MRRALASIGGILLVLSAAMARGCVGGPPTGHYPLTITLEDTSYQLSGKPPNDVYHSAFGGSIEWVFTNGTNAPVQVKLDTWETLSAGSTCPVHFTSGGGPGDCEATLPNIPVGKVGTIVAEPAMGSLEDPYNPYMFRIAIGPVSGPLKRADPELQIDQYFNFQALVAALLGLAALVGAWWVGRRSAR